MRDRLWEVIGLLQSAVKSMRCLPEPWPDFKLLFCLSVLNWFCWPLWYWYDKSLSRFCIFWFSTACFNCWFLRFYGFGLFVVAITDCDVLNWDWLASCARFRLIWMLAFFLPKRLGSWFTVRFVDLMIRSLGSKLLFGEMCNCYACCQY